MQQEAAKFLQHQALSTGTGHVHRESYGNFKSTVASPATLQDITSSDQQQNKEGTSMVDMCVKLTAGTPICFPSHQYWCWNQMDPRKDGEQGAWKQAQGMLVSYRSTVSHQLPRIISCLYSP